MKILFKIVFFRIEVALHFKLFPVPQIHANPSSLTPSLNKSLSVRNLNLPIVAIRLMPQNSPSDDRPMSFLSSSPLPAVHIIAVSFLSPLINLKNYGPLLTLSFHVKLLLHFLPLLLLLFLPLPFSTSLVTRLQNSALPLTLFLLLLHLLIFLLLHLLLPSPHSLLLLLMRSDLPYYLLLMVLAL